MLAFVMPGRVERPMASSRRLSEVRASPSENAERYLRSSVSMRSEGV